MATAELFTNCPQYRFRFVDSVITRADEQTKSTQCAAPATDLGFRLPPPLAVQVQELESDAPSVQADVIMRALAIESPVPEAPLAAAQAWLADGQSSSEPIRTMQLQGSTILQLGQRLAIFTETEERVAKLMNALLETVYLEREIGRLESELATSWATWEADTPLSFQFGERQLKTRERLAEHHNSVHRCRSRLERLSPAIHAPHVYPPTFASQASERYRERTHLAHRHEVLSEQLQPFEELYESCAQRASDYAIARTGHQLEWAIIILLLIQIIFSSAEILTSLETTEPPAPAAVSEALAADAH